MTIHPLGSHSWYGHFTESDLSQIMASKFYLSKSKIFITVSTHSVGICFIDSSSINIEMPAIFLVIDRNSSRLIHPIFPKTLGGYLFRENGKQCILKLMIRTNDYNDIFTIFFVNLFQKLYFLFGKFSIPCHSFLRLPRRSTLFHKCFVVFIFNGKLSYLAVRSSFK